MKYSLKFDKDRQDAKNRLFDLLNGFVDSEDAKLSNADLINIVTQRWLRYYDGDVVKVLKKDNSIMAGIR